MNQNSSAPTPAITTGMLMALAATLIWSGNFIIARGLNNVVEPATLAFMRWTTATVLLAPFAAKAVWRSRAALRRHLQRITLTALLGVTVFNTVLYLAARTTVALNLALISTSMPMFIILFERMAHGAPITRRKLGGLTAAVLGVALIVTRGDLSVLAGLDFARGDLWMLAASAIFAVYSLLVRNKPKEIEATAFLGACFGLGLVMLAPWAGAEMLVHGLPPMTPQVLGAVLYIGLGASLLSYLFWNGAVSRIGPAKAGMIYYSLPLFSGLEAWLFLGEPVGWHHLLGGLCIVGGIYAATRTPKT